MSKEVHFIRTRPGRGAGLLNLGRKNTDLSGEKEDDEVMACSCLNDYVRRVI